MNIGDSRSGEGPGFLPFQDHSWKERGLTLDSRFSVIGLRITGIRDGTGQIGHKEYGEDTVGDVNGWFIWPAASREIGAWYPVSPAIRPLTPGTGGGGGGGGGPETGGPAGEVPPNSRDPRDITPSSGSGGGVGFDLDEASAGFPSSRSGLTSDVPSGGSGGGFDMFPEPASGDTSDAGSGKVLPIRDESWLPDDRFEPQLPTSPAGAAADQEAPFPAFPGGHVGLMVAASNEDKQILQFHPTDPRLVAPHHGGAEAHGSFVVDLSGDGDHSAQRKAHLQSFFRVIRRPSGDFSLQNGSMNTLSWNIGRTGRGAIIGGFVTDKGGVATRHAMVSVRDGGPLDVGADGDVHQIGQDQDGNPINPLHFSTLSLWRGLRRDGPLAFEDRKWPDPGELPFKVKVHLVWNPGPQYQLTRDGGGKSYRGVWDWYSSSLFAETTPKPTTDTPEPVPGPSVPPGPPGPGPITPGGGDPGGPTTGGGDPPQFSIGPSKSSMLVERSMGFTTLETSFPALSGRPQFIRDGAPDLIHWQNPPADAVQRYNDRSPTTWRAYTYGEQGGTAGDSVLAPAGSSTPRDEFVRTQEPNASRSRGGTGNGGLVFAVPEADLGDVDDDLTPANVTPSTSYIMAAPGVRWGVGVPDLPSGGLRDGYSWEVNSSGEMEMYRHDGSATRTLVLTLKQTGVVQLADGVNVAVGGTTGTQLGTTAVQKVGFHGATPSVKQTGWSTSNVVTTRSYDADLTDPDELADVLGTLIADLTSKGLIGA